ncbi:MAG: preprotein translocase subunit YajC [Saprospiraceae bacterium]
MNYIFLQAPGGIDPSIINAAFLFLMIAIFYFFMIRPQTQKQKAQTKFMDELKKGDDVATASGILGRINKIDNEIVTLEVGTKTFIQVTKNAISKEMSEAVFSKEVAKAK